MTLLRKCKLVDFPGQNGETMINAEKAAPLGDRHPETEVPGPPGWGENPYM
jgi:hypothetical protein